MDTESAAQPISDFLVIGAGSAGCVLARRLLDAGHTVTLVEAGEQDISPDIDDVSRLGLLWGSPVDWNYHTEPQPGLDGRRIHLPRGKVLGGSHSLNAAIWVRGDRSDFDHWADSGCPGWGWEDVVPYFEAIEACPAGDPALRGQAGPLPITTQYPHHPVQQAMYDAAAHEGIPENPDYNSGSVDGLGWMQLTVRDDKRVSTWRAYMKPVVDHPGLRLITGGHVRRLLVDGTTVTGAEVTVDGQHIECSAEEVVLSAGTFGSAELLLRSGIGPADHLQEIGIDVVRDAPGVGRNLHDHLLTPVICTTREALPAPEVAAAQVHYWAASDPSLPAPDTQPIFFSVPMYTNTAGDPMVGPEDGFSLLAGIVRPSSRGQLTLSGPGAEDPVRIDLGAFAEEEDLRSMLFSLRQCRSIAAQPALAELGAQEIFPGPEVGDTDEELIAYIRSTTTTYHHPVGTCAMGPDDGAAVVDPETLRVHGIQGLRVADASIMPRVTTGNTNAPSVLIGEKAAAAITSVTPF